MKKPKPESLVWKQEAADDHEKGGTFHQVDDGDLNLEVHEYADGHMCISVWSERCDDFLFRRVLKRRVTLDRAKKILFTWHGRRLSDRTKILKRLIAVVKMAEALGRKLNKDADDDCFFCDTWAKSSEHEDDCASHRLRKMFGEGDGP